MTVHTNTNSNTTFLNNWTNIICIIIQKREKKQQIVPLCAVQIIHKRTMSSEIEDADGSRRCTWTTSIWPTDLAWHAGSVCRPFEVICILTLLKEPKVSPAGKSAIQGMFIKPDFSDLFMNWLWGSLRRNFGTFFLRRIEGKVWWNSSRFRKSLAVSLLLLISYYFFLT